MDYPEFNMSNQKEETISIQKVNQNSFTTYSSSLILTGFPSESTVQSLDGLISPFSRSSCNFFCFFALSNLRQCHRLYKVVMKLRTPGKFGHTFANSGNPDEMAPLLFA